MIKKLAYFAAALGVLTLGLHVLAHLTVTAGAESFLRERTVMVGRAVAWVAERERLREDEAAEGSTQRFLEALSQRMPALERGLVLDGTRIVASSDPARLGARLDRESLADKLLYDAAKTMKADVAKNQEERAKHPELGRDAYREVAVVAGPGQAFTARVPVKLDGELEAMTEVVLRAEALPVLFPIGLVVVGGLALGVFVPIARLRRPAAVLGAAAGLLAGVATLQVLQLHDWQAKVRADRAERLAVTAATLAEAGLLRARGPAADDAGLLAAMGLDSNGFQTERLAEVRSATVASAVTEGAGAPYTIGGYVAVVGVGHLVRSAAEEAGALDRWAAAVAVMAALVLVLGFLGQLDRFVRALVTHRSAYAYLSPAMVGLVVLVFIPVTYGLSLGFQERRYNEYVFVGLGNFAEILSDFDLSNPRSFWFKLAVTVLWTMANVSLHVTIGLFLALLLNDPMLKAKGIYRVLLVVPWAIPNYVTALIWKSMFHSQFGAVNAFLGVFGVEGMTWFQEFWPAFTANVTTNTWLGFPFMMVVSLGALQSIPTDLYEAARVDGASRWQRFSRITLPLLMPALVPAVIVGTVWTFNMFNVIYLVSGGAPNGATDILITDAYRWAFEADRKGFAAAYSTVIFLILLGFTLVTNRFTGATKGAFE